MSNAVIYRWQPTPRQTQQNSTEATSETALVLRQWKTWPFIVTFLWSREEESCKKNKSTNLGNTCACMNFVKFPKTIVQGVHSLIKVENPQIISRVMKKDGSGCVRASTCMRAGMGRGRGAYCGIWCRAFDAGIVKELIPELVISLYWPLPQVSICSYIVQIIKNALVQ